MITMDNFRTALLISLAITIYGIGLSSAQERCKESGGNPIDCHSRLPMCLINKDGIPGSCVAADECTLSTDEKLVCNTEKCCCKAVGGALCNDPALNKDIICAEGALKQSAELCKEVTPVSPVAGPTPPPPTGTGTVTCKTGNRTDTEVCLNEGSVCISDLKGKPMGCGVKENCTTDDNRKVNVYEAKCSLDTGFCCCINSPADKPCNDKEDENYGEILSMALPGEINGVEGLKAWRYNLVVSVVATSFALKDLITE